MARTTLGLDMADTFTSSDTCRRQTNGRLQGLLAGGHQVPGGRRPSYSEGCPCTQAPLRPAAPT